MDDVLNDAFLPALFEGDTYQIPGIEITVIPANQYGIALPDPAKTDGSNWTASCVITGNLIAALHGMA